jgi:hypothetical protein
MHSSRTNDTPIWWPLRVWLGVEALFGVFLVLTIFLHPDQTQQSFAWIIEPGAMAAALGAFSLAIAPMFAGALLTRRWQQVRVMVVPLIVFNLAMLLATAIHLNRFSEGIAPFKLWLASCALTPPAFGLLYRWHQLRSAPIGSEVAAPIAPKLRDFFRINGLAVTIAASAIFVLPGLLQRVGPWGFTPLTARAFSAWLLVFGLLQGSMSREADWERARLATLFLIVLPSALLLQLWRFREQVDWVNGFLFVLLADVTLTAGACILLWLATGESGPATSPSFRAINSPPEKL